MPKPLNLGFQEATIIPQYIISSSLTDYASEFGISLSEKDISRFGVYLQELKLWNEKFNLTAIRDDRDIVIKHFLDSLTPCRLIPPGSKILDIGSGAGFPGIPLKIAIPSLNVTLLDSVNKKVSFMKHIISELGLTGIEAIHVRAEDLAKTRKGEFDIVISRALASLAEFIKIGGPFLKPDGRLLAMKGSRAEEEVEAAADIMKKKGMRIRSIEKLSLPLGAGDRGILVLEWAD